MMKLKIIVFFVLINSFWDLHGQKPKSLDSLAALTALHIQKFKITSPTQDAQHFTSFLTFLEQQKKNYSLPTEQQQLKQLKIKTMLAYMAKMQADYGMLDSIEHYQKKIKQLTPNDEQLFKAYDITGYAYKQQQKYMLALKNYYKALDLVEKTTNPELKIRKINTYKLMIGLLFEIQSYHHAGLLIDKADAYLNQFNGHKDYNKYKDKLILLKTILYLETNEAVKALSTLELLKNKKRHKYYNLKQKIYFELGDFNKSNKYLEQTYLLLEGKENLNHKRTKKYWYYKLRLSIAKEAFKEMDQLFPTFKTILDASETNIHPDFYELAHDYYKLKNNIALAYPYYLKAKQSKAKKDVIATKQRIEVDGLMLKRDQSISTLHKSNAYKDLLLAKNEELFWYFAISLVCIFTSLFLIFFYLRKKRTLALHFQIKSAKAIIEAKDKYLANLAHEIRTPITIIKGYLDLIEHNALKPQKIDEYSKLGKINATKLLGSLNNYLELIKHDVPKTQAKIPKPTHSVLINTAVKQIAEAFMPLATIGKLRLWFKTNVTEQSTMYTNINAIENILNNLLSNALKFSVSGGNIFISVMYYQKQIFIQVKDEGVGVSKENQSHLFNRFYQTEDSAKNTSGFGIGLSIVKELASQIGGKVTLKSQLSQGASFRIYLPLTPKDEIKVLAKSEVKYIAMQTATEPSITASTPKEELPKILIIDDDFEMLRYLKNLFEANYECLLANNGQEALKILAKQLPQLIISDVKMPILDGISLKEHLNKKERLKNIPFIIMTALEAKNHEELQLRLGIDEYLFKPFSARELEIRVQNKIKKQAYKQLVTSEADSIKLKDDTINQLFIKMKDLVHKNIENDAYKVNELAEDLAYSQHQLNRLLKQHMGMTLSSFILEMKLLKAYEYITKQQKATLNEIIFAVGLNSRSYFNKRFENRFGIKPGELMKQYKLHTPSLT